MTTEHPLSETTDTGRILVRGIDLADELIGQATFTELLLLELHGTRMPSSHVRVVDAVLVAIAEHGATPSSTVSRLVTDAAPESMQGAIAAGLLAAGDRFLGTVENAARLLQVVVAAGGNLERSARDQVRVLLAAGERIPGFGHNLHRDGDPRVVPLLELARSEAVAARHVAALGAVESAVRSEVGALPTNAAGAVGAILSDLGYTAQSTRGFALVARAAGLFAHVMDEREHPAARGLWESRHGSVEEK